ncbi:hypothetical protein [Panacagrimonas sp.]|uniref:hypothetical protein n=1 Tax=Panacagrimonas sp. TaxID=2480088 RepID=UPI003B5205FC
MTFKNIALIVIGAALALASSVLAVGTVPMLMEAFQIMQSLGIEGPFLNSAFVMLLCLLFLLIGLRLARSGWRSYSASKA